MMGLEAGQSNVANPPVASKVLTGLPPLTEGAELYE